MTPKQKWYCFWAILVVVLLLTVGFVWVAVHNPQASWYTVFSNIWENITSFIVR